MQDELAERYVAKLFASMHKAKQQGEGVNAPQQPENVYTKAVEEAQADIGRSVGAPVRHDSPTLDAEDAISGLVSGWRQSVGLE